ncbi:zinc ribbon domain-containing protein [Natronomonas sp. LN261]|jgi:Arc/MetJ-type ribon-helix-helix transcriptional regulator|uniref:double zinc ribbon domain-containing protein n=1 Tax=Natronomonas sp. LN261 TaxID=2750669 RepID=UPI0015EF797F|nr:zinc ribbon domain-containing protein [Natronomonas sp. LN261]
MSKITFRADDELIHQLEEFDASKSEVMREALRRYLDENSDTSVNAAKSGSSGESDGRIAGESLDDLIADRVDALVSDRLERAYTPREPQDVNVNITLDGDSGDVSHASGDDRKTPTAERENASDESGHTCKQCGETLPQSAVYCSNCGEKASHRVFCECGDEIRSDWGFCPSCGRRTPAADVLRDT